MSPILSVRNVTAGYGATDVVRAVSFDVAEGTLTTIIGPNGSGKSTLIKVLAGLLPVRHGRILLEGADVAKLDAPRKIASGIGYVPQEHNVFRNMTVAENLSLATEFLPLARRCSERGDVLELFPDLVARLRHLAGHLSGGQRQMLALACALLARPKLLLLDEPSVGLSPRYVGQIFATIRSVQATGITILLVEQNTAAALPISDTAIVLAAGEVKHVGTAAALARDPEIHRLYLGARA